MIQNLSAHLIAVPACVSCISFLRQRLAIFVSSWACHAWHGAGTGEAGLDKVPPPGMEPFSLGDVFSLGLRGFTPMFSASLSQMLEERSHRGALSKFS